MDMSERGLALQSPQYVLCLFILRSLPLWKSPSWRDFHTGIPEWQPVSTRLPGDFSSPLLCLPTGQGSVLGTLEWPRCLELSWLPLCIQPGSERFPTSCYCPSWPNQCLLLREARPDAQEGGTAAHHLPF